MRHGLLLAVGVAYSLIVILLAVQLAVVPPFVPAHVHDQGPLPLTADGVPVLHRLLVGTVVMDPPLMLPQVPFVIWLLSPLSALTWTELTLTGSNLDKVKFVMHDRSVSFHRASGVPIIPPVNPLSARMIPYWRIAVRITFDCGLLLLGHVDMAVA
jgi:hypothetical protein